MSPEALADLKRHVLDDADEGVPERKEALPSPGPGDDAPDRCSPATPLVT